MMITNAPKGRFFVRAAAPALIFGRGVLPQYLIPSPKLRGTA